MTTGAAGWGAEVVSAEYLRSTASLVRERAEAATPGPWESEHRGYAVYETHTSHGDVGRELDGRTWDEYPDGFDSPSEREDGHVV